MPYGVHENDILPTMPFSLSQATRGVLNTVSDRTLNYIALQFYPQVCTFNIVLQCTEMLPIRAENVIQSEEGFLNLTF